MKAITHTLVENLQSCSVCGEVIPANPDQDMLWRAGNSVGVLTSKWTLPVSYLTGKHDQNERCNPSVLSGAVYIPSTKPINSATSAPDAN